MTTAPGPSTGMSAPPHHQRHDRQTPELCQWDGETAH
jgi:hypothetical protein